MLDGTMAILIATALLVSFGVAVGGFRRAERKLADDRAAARRLEDNLLALQRGEKAEPELPVERMPGTVAGSVWVRISTPAGQKPQITLVGLVPADRAPGGAQ
jgi:hypothetical protein